jgi:hypothetical protein
MPKQNVHFSLIYGHILFTCFAPLAAQEWDSPQEAEAYVATLQDLEGVLLPLNQASEPDLLELPGLTPDIARRITAFRPYKTLQDLYRVPGMTPELLDQISPYLILNDRPNWHGRFIERLTRPSNHPDKVDHLRLRQRADIQIGDGIQGFLLIDRDPEEDSWTDYLTAHVKISHPLGQLILGDVRPEIGQGLLHSRQSRGTASLSTIRPRSQSRIGNRGGTEFGAIRGVHLTTRLFPVKLEALYGRLFWDADISPDGTAQIRRTESHISEASLSRKHLLTEGLATLHLSVGTPHDHIGLTYQRLTFSPSNPQDGITRHISIDHRAQWHDAVFFGEFASGTHSNAFLTGLVWKKSGLRLHLLMRRYSPYFSGLHGAPITAFGTPAKNESGLFFGFTYQPIRRTRIELSLDRHRQLIAEQFPLPDMGHRFRLAVRHRFGKRVNLQIKHSSRKRGYNLSRTENRGTLNWKPGATRTTVWVSKTKATASENGFAFGLRQQIGHDLRLALWATAYNVPDYDARIYSFEPDVWGSGSLQVLSGRGRSSGILLAWSNTSFRIATRYSRRNTDAHPTTSWSVQFELQR